MDRRSWFYLGVTIVVTGLLTWQLAISSRIRLQINRQTTQANTQRQQALETYLKAAKNERKMITLAKLYKDTEPELLQAVIDRAYELNPNSRDITILASFYHPELKAKITEIDPLFQSAPDQSQ